MTELASERAKQNIGKFRINQEDVAVDYEVVRGDELLSMEGESLPYLVEPILPRSGLVGFGGSSDTGKSTFLKQLATAIVRGNDEFLGFPINSTHKSVIYVSTEDDKDGVLTVLKRQKKKGSRKNPMHGLRFLFNSEKIYGQIKAELKKESADLVIIDAFSDIAQGDLNQSSVVRPFMERFSNLSKKHQCLFIFLHHTSKKAEGTVPKKGNLLGSQGFEAKCRLVMLLVRDPGEDHIRHLCLVKGNYLSDEYKSQSYAMDFNPDDLTFKFTGERVLFEDLSSKDGTRKKETLELKKRAQELRNNGMTQGQIAIEVGRDKSQISRWFAEAEKEKQSAETDKTFIEELKGHLESFLKSQPKYKDAQDLYKKYDYANREDKTRIRNQFKRYAKLNEKLTNEQFLELFDE